MGSAEKETCPLFPIHFSSSVSFIEEVLQEESCDFRVAGPAAETLRRWMTRVVMVYAHDDDDFVLHEE